MQLYEIRIILFSERETAEGALRAIGDLFDEEMGHDNYGATLYEGVQGEGTDVTIPADSPLIKSFDNRSVDEIMDAIEVNLDLLIDAIEDEEDSGGASLSLVPEVPES